MNNIIIVAKRFVICIVVMFSMTNAAVAEVHNSYLRSRMTKSELQQRLGNISSEVSLRYTEEVHEIVDTYIRGYRRGSEQILGRTNVFFPIFDLELENNLHIPDEVKHLAIIESSLKVHAVSRTGAVGLWQFMKETAKLQGLSVNDNVDERKDPYLSTKAAYKYLTKLHKEFGDWTLALAAYNCGPGNVRKAIRKSQSKDFWKLERFLPKETRRYIPKFIATSYLMNYFDFHQLTPNVEPPIFEKTAIARIYVYTNFSDITKVTGVNESTIRKLNPAFNRNYIPRSTKGYLLTLPEQEMFHYLIFSDKIENLEFTLTNPQASFEKTIIFSGFQMRHAELESLNKMPVLMHVVKSPIQKKSSIISGTSLSAIKIEEDIEYHRMIIGESLSDLVARRANTTLEEIISLNNIDINNPPKPGDFIKVRK
ncbi:MAG: transglycosylase SLT domain-containing protein [Saprospiraceae bacterium]